MDAEPPPIVAPAPSAPAPSSAAPSSAAPTPPPADATTPPPAVAAPPSDATPSAAPAAPAPSTAPTPTAAPTTPEAPLTTVRAYQEPPPPPPPLSPLELGAGAFLFSGGPAGGYAGTTAYLQSDWGHGVWVRPSLLFGRSTGTAIQSTLGGARLDVCARIEGNYSRGGGIQLDLCGGVEGAYASLQHGDQAGEPASDSGQPYLALGPSVDLRAELGRLAITIRTVAGFDVTQESFLDVTGAKVYAPILPLRVELALSWDLHGQDAPAPPPVEDIAGR